MLIYSTLTGKKELLKKTNKIVNLFVCGPTVYDHPHLGHARTYIFFDCFVRYLKSLKYKIFYLQNITDIDDKIIERAKKERVDPAILAKKFGKVYLGAMKELNVASVNIYAPATVHIKEIISQIKTLLAKGHAYEILGDGIYFDIKSFPDYGKLSGRTAEAAEDATSRIDESVNKRNKGDFALWKFSKGNEPSWSFETGKNLSIYDGRPAFAKASAGKPGWHIEDTAITEKYFGPQYDIHGGGLDLKFPHHEAEIAQAESISGKKPLVKIWMHTGFLFVNGKKMSKSLGNFVAISDFLEKYNANTLRFLTLSHHYRSPIDYNGDMAEQARKTFDSLLLAVSRLKFIAGNNAPLDRVIEGPVTGDWLEKSESAFQNALDDDFNTPMALAALFELVNNLNGAGSNNASIYGISKKDAAKFARLIINKLEMLGFLIKFPKIPQKINDLAEKREKSRKKKQFIQSNDLRKEINELGYMVEDTPIGQFIRPMANPKSKIQNPKV